MELVIQIFALIVLLVSAIILILVDELGGKLQWIIRVVKFMLLLLILLAVCSGISLILDVYAWSQLSSQASHLDLPELGNYMAWIGVVYFFNIVVDSLMFLLSSRLGILIYTRYRRLVDEYVSYYYTYGGFADFP
jgi:hypothetical protein